MGRTSLPNCDAAFLLQEIARIAAQYGPDIASRITGAASAAMEAESDKERAMALLDLLALAITARPAPPRGAPKATRPWLTGSNNSPTRCPDGLRTGARAITLRPPSKRSWPTCRASRASAGATLSAFGRPCRRTATGGRGKRQSPQWTQCCGASAPFWKGKAGYESCSFSPSPYR